MKLFGEFEPVESKLVVSLWSVSVSAEAFLRLDRLKRPETVEDTVPLDSTEGARTESLRWGAEQKVSRMEIRSKKNYAHSGAGVDDLVQQWARGGSPEESLNCRVVRINFGEAADIRRR